MPKPLIVGQAPARGNDGLPPFSGRSGSRLAQLAGVGDTGDILPQYFQLINLVDFWPGKTKSGKGDYFPKELAVDKADRIRRRLLSPTQTPRVIFMMGAKVAECFGMGDMAMLTGRQVAQHHFIKFPHPSGVSLHWNDSTNSLIASWILRGALRGW